MTAPTDVLVPNSQPNPWSSDASPAPVSEMTAATTAIDAQYSQPPFGRKMKNPTRQWTVTMATSIIAMTAAEERGVTNPAAIISPAPISVAAAVIACAMGHFRPMDENQPDVPANPFFTLFTPWYASDSPNTSRSRSRAKSILFMVLRHLFGGCVTDTIGRVSAENADVESRFRRGAGLIRSLVRLRRGQFVIAVSGAAVFALCTAGSSLGVKWMIDRVVVARFEEGDVAVSTVVGACLLIIAISAVRATGVVVRRTFAGRTEWGVAESLGVQVVQRFAEQPIVWHRSHQTGDLVARANVDVEASVAVLAPLPYGSSVVLLLVASAVGLTVMDVVLGAVAMVVLPMLVFMNIGYQRRVDKHFDEAQKQMGRLAEAALESFEGVAVVKAFGAEERETERLSEITGLLREARIKAMRARANFEMMLDTVPSMANLVLLSVGAVRVRSGDITVGDLAAAMYLFTLLVIPLRLIGYVFSEIPHSYAGFRRVREILDAPLVPDPRLSLGVADGGTALRVSGAGIHHIPELPVIKGASFTLKEGSLTALVGATGSGKSTLLEAITGIVPVAEGSIDVPCDGAVLVFQEAFIFAESVRFNLCLGSEVSDDVLTEALRVADAQFLLDLEDGLDTSLGERGVSLSGGQRQRLALARALVRRPRLLLLDDTTSALDPTTELRVLSNLVESELVSTVLMVASRPSAIAAADGVLFVTKAGKVMQGTHAELAATNLDYRDLIEAFDDDRRDQETVR